MSRRLNLLCLFFIALLPLTHHIAEASPIAVAEASSTTVYVDGYYGTFNGYTGFIPTGSGEVVSFSHAQSSADPFQILIGFAWCFDIQSTDSWFVTSSFDTLHQIADAATDKSAYSADGKYFYARADSAAIPSYAYWLPGTYTAALRVLDDQNPYQFDDDFITINVLARLPETSQPVPEPSTVLLFGVGIAGLVLLKFHRSKTA